MNYIYKKVTQLCHFFDCLLILLHNTAAPAANIPCIAESILKPIINNDNIIDNIINNPGIYLSSILCELFIAFPNI